MARSVEHLREGRAQKVGRYLKRKYPNRVPWEFLLEHSNTAAYGKFNTKEDAERL